MSTRSEQALAEVLRKRLRGHVVVIGVGNPLRGDDGVGSFVARELARGVAARGASDIVVIDAEEIPEAFIGSAVDAKPDTILIVDAADLNAPAGSAVLLGAAALQGRAVTTHRTPLGPLAAMLKRETSADVLFLGIQPGDERWGEHLSDDVAATARRLRDDLADILCRQAHAGVS